MQDRDQCPPNTRACLTIVNEKEGEPDRVTTVVPIAGGVGELDPTISFAPGTKGAQGRRGETIPFGTSTIHSDNVRLLPTDRLSVILRGGQTSDRTRWANLTFLCTPGEDGLEPAFNYHRTESEGVLSVEWRTRHACPQGQQGDDQGRRDSDQPHTGTGILAWFGSFLVL